MKLFKSNLLSCTVFLLLFPALCQASIALPVFDVKDLTPYWPSATARDSRKPATLYSFKVVDQAGQTVSERDLNNQISLVNFFYAQCGGVCPFMMNSLQEFQSQFRKEHSKIQFSMYSFSVAPNEDTPETLSRYASGRHLDLKNWHLLTGERKVIYDLGREVFHADGTINAQASSQESEFIHTSNIYLIDSHRQIRGIYDTSSAEQLKLLAIDMTKLASQ